MHQENINGPTMSAWYAHTVATAPAMAQCALMKRGNLGGKYGRTEGSGGEIIDHFALC